MLRFRFARPALALSRWGRHLVTNTPGFRILIFHDIPLSYHQAFKDLIVYLKNKNALISPNQAAAWVSGTIPENVETRGTTPPCLISFDDGFLSNFELAATTLNNLDIRALFFVCPGLIGMGPFEQGEAVNRFIFSNNRPVLDEPSRLALMGWSQIRDLASMGHTIGAHGMMHQRLTELTGEELSYEIVLAGDIIEEKLSSPINWYAYSFGDINSVSLDVMTAISQRFSFCRSGVRGGNAAGSSPLAILADHIDINAPWLYQRFTLEGGLDPRYIVARYKLRKIAREASRRLSLNSL